MTNRPTSRSPVQRLNGENSRQECLSASIDQRADRFAEHRIEQAVFIPNIEHNQRLFVIHTKRDGRQVHYTYPVFERLRIGQVIKAPGSRVGLGSSE